MSLQLRIGLSVAWSLTRYCASLQNGSYSHRVQATGPLVVDPGSNLLLPLPS
jgi:hypothetical protein